MRSVIKQSVLGILVVTALGATLPAFGARIEYQATRQNILPGALVPTNLPMLTTNTAGAGNTFVLTGGGADSLSGNFTIRSNHIAPNGSALFTGLATYTGGTGVYAGATGQNAFAGIFDARTGATTVADYGFVDAPNFAGPDLFVASLFGTPAATSPLAGGGMYDLSAVRTDTPYNDLGPVRISIPLSVTEPFELTQNSADNSGGYKTTGPGGAFIRGNYFTSVGVGYGNSNIFAGYTFVADGGAPGWDVTGGSGVFVGRNTRQNPDDTTGLEYVTDFAYVTAQRVPEPPMSLLMLVGLGTLALPRLRPSSRTSSHTSLRSSLRGAHL